ncbi:hypothetical protein [[Clostridium] symbiosum]|uniref:hypothetical protein n=1 Tax=Clostridium symbiosum TaxID=1512 RepID=UPI001AA1D246|nr:hypothetical protein [[Clostridium] symbiosum]MBO1695198.1 hypothetical protein [[Clostridium] symbiosum]
MDMLTAREIERYDPPQEAEVLRTRCSSGVLLNNLDDINRDYSVEEKGYIRCSVVLSNRDFDRLCYDGLSSNRHSFISQVYGRKRKIKANERNREAYELIKVQNENQDCIYMAVRQNGCIPFFSLNLREMETFQLWNQEAQKMDDYVMNNRLGYVEEKLINDPDVGGSGIDVVLDGIHHRRTWPGSFEFGSSVNDVISWYVSEATEKAVNDYLDEKYGRQMVQNSKKNRR